MVGADRGFQAVAQRLGQHDIGADRQDGEAQARQHPVQVAAGAHHHLLRFHRAARRADALHIAIEAEAGRRAVLEDPHAQPFGGGRRAAREVQRMEVEAVGIMDRVEIALRQIEVANPGARPEFQLGAESLVHEGDVGLLLLRSVEPGDVQLAVDQRAAGHGILIDAAADDVHRLLCEAEERLRILHADVLHDGGRAEGIARRDEAAIAPRRAEADLLAFQHDHVGHAAFGEAQRGGEAGHAAADNADIRLHIALQGCAAKIVGQGAAVIAVDIIVRHGGEIIRTSRPLEAGLHPVRRPR